MNDSDPSDDWLDRIGRFVGPYISAGALIVLWGIIPLGSLAVTASIYMKTGIWHLPTLAEVSGWAGTSSEWVGLNEITANVAGLWFGFHSMAAGTLIIWIVSAWDS